jgi:hypothetical protein
MKKDRISLKIDERDWPWVVRHARRLGYYGARDYVQAILNTAMDAEREANGESLPRPSKHTDPYGDGIPL